MTSMNKLLIPGVLVATVLVAGVFAFIPVEKATTFDEFIIAAINGDAGISNQDIAEELKDKLKLMVEEEEQTINLSVGTPGFTIEVEATNAELENVPFNLKEVYLCGYSGVVNLTVFPIRIEFVHIEDVDFDPNGSPFGADITITNSAGTNMALVVIDGYTCVDVVSALAKSGRAGAVGLGSDSNLVIEFSGDSPESHVDFVKCIAFTPNEATTLKCDMEPITLGA